MELIENKQQKINQNKQTKTTRKKKTNKKATKMHYFCKIFTVIFEFFEVSYS